MFARIFACLCLWTVALAAAADSIPERKPSIIQKVINYFRESNQPKPNKRFDWSVIGGPFYSTDTHFGIGIVAGAQYRQSLADSLLQPSVAALKLQGSTTLFYKIGLEGTHLFPHDKVRLMYDISFQSLPTYFWGIGYGAGANRDHKAKYIDNQFAAIATGMARVAGPLWVGGGLHFSFNKAADRRSPEFWTDIPTQVTAFGTSVDLMYDTRDNLTYPTRGWVIRASAAIWPKFLGNSDHHFWSMDLNASYYRPLWKGAVMAARFESYSTIGHTPWSLMPTFGGSSAMRGYYKGQYRDKCETDITWELRQHIWKRSGAVAWVGAGTVYPYLSAIRLSQILPNWGIGYRWEFKKHANVRLDLGFGHRCYGIEFGLNEAF